jgi:hypothetical protein
VVLGAAGDEVVLVLVAVLGAVDTVEGGVDVVSAVSPLVVTPIAIIANTDFITSIGIIVLSLNANSLAKGFKEVHLAEVLDRASELEEELETAGFDAVGVLLSLLPPFVPVPSPPTGGSFGTGSTIGITMMIGTTMPFWVTEDVVVDKDVLNISPDGIDMDVVIKALVMIGTAVADLLD